MSAHSVSFQHIGKQFGAVNVLLDFDLEVQPGEFLVLLGESGSGKSTALRILAGLEYATEGRLLIGERDVTDAAPKDRDIAMVFQSYALYPHKTVAENIAYPLKVRGTSKAEIQKAVEKAAEQVQLQPFLQRLPSELSGGQRQRVALARAMVRTPSVFLMDEPLSNLDAKLRGHMRTEMKHLQRQLGITTLYVTHDQVEAMTLAHRVALLDKGVLQQLDTPERIYNDPANLFVAGFIGSPPMNFLAGTLSGGRFTAATFSAPTGSTASTENAVLGIRPEDCRIVSPAEPVADDECSFVAELYADELMGDHKLFTLSVEGQRVRVKADKKATSLAHECVAFHPAKAYVFNAETGQRLR